MQIGPQTGPLGWLDSQGEGGFDRMRKLELGEIESRSATLQGLSAAQGRIAVGV